jgi:tetratricopeptide (TPR) repeat protein
MASTAAPATAPVVSFPKDGLPPSYLRHFIDENGGESWFTGLTTSDVKHRIIVPKTRASKLSLCAQLQQEGDTCVQPATWFVSHAWQYKFLDLVTALEAFFADKPGAIMWLDLLSTSQHATFDKPPEWWQKTFCSAIGAMGQVVMVMTPWDSPVCLTRAWCLIELYACRSSDSEFCVALPPSERARFVKEMCEKAGAFYGMLSKVNTANSQCSRESDRDRIFAAVRGLEGGFTGLDRNVLHTMTEWLQRQLDAEIVVAASAGREDTEVSLMSALGGLLKDQGMYYRALPVFEDCLAKRKRILGEDHPDTLTSLNHLASLLECIGEYDRALPIFEDCLAKRRLILGEDHPDTLTSLNDLASLLESMEEYDRALPIFEDCLAKRRLILGEDHPDTLTSLNHLASLLESMEVYYRALPIFEDCLAKRRLILGEDHPDTLTSLHNVALILKSLGEYDRARPVYEDCLAKRKRILGEDHHDTLTSLNNLAGLFLRMGDYDRALPIFEDCLAKMKRTLGEDHPDTLTSINNLGASFYSTGHFDRALLLFEEYTTKRKIILGEDHPHTQAMQQLRDLCVKQLAGHG